MSQALHRPVYDHLATTGMGLDNAVTAAMDYAFKEENVPWPPFIDSFHVRVRSAAATSPDTVVVRLVYRWGDDTSTELRLMARHTDNESNGDPIYSIAQPEE